MRENLGGSRGSLEGDFFVADKAVDRGQADDEGAGDAGGEGFSVGDVLNEA